LENKQGAIMSDIENLKNSDLPLVLYGAAELAECAVCFLNLHKIKIDFVAIDKEYCKPNTKFCDFEIMPLEDVLANNNQVNIIMAFISKNNEEKIAELNKMPNVNLCVFFDDLFQGNSGDTSVPPKIIPKDLEQSFTINGKIPVLDWYWDERVVSRPTINTHNKYERAFEMLNSKKFKYYGDDIWSFYDAFADYSLKDKTVIIFGLTGCNCEAMAVWQNAKKVYVVDYNKPICDHEKIEVLSHEELSQSGLKFDIGISFSSFEHDGLGRYGDPILPDGDLEAMQYAKSLIKEDGLLFLGVPMGKDCLVWNAHRIYGAIRLPELLNGWLCLDVYHKKSIELFDEPLGTWVNQPLVVLQNIGVLNEQNFVKRNNYANELQSLGKSGTRDGDLLEMILKMHVDEYQKYGEL
jgi:hypothetical protein